MESKRGFFPGIAPPRENFLGVGPEIFLENFTIGHLEKGANAISRVHNVFNEVYMGRAKGKGGIV